MNIQYSYQSNDPEHTQLLREKNILAEKWKEMTPETLLKSSQQRQNATQSSSEIRSAQSRFLRRGKNSGAA